MSDNEKQYKDPKLYDSDQEIISKNVKVLDLFYKAMVLLGGDKYVACSCVLPPLLSSFTKHMTISDDDSGYITKLKAVSANDFSECVADTKSI